MTIVTPISAAPPEAATSHDPADPDATPRPTPALPLEVRKFQRWSDDTRIAFLLGLRLYGNVRDAAAAIGRELGSAYRYRSRHPDFAAAWDEAHRAGVAAQAERRAAARAAAGMPTIEEERDERKRRPRFDGWTLARRRGFLRALSETGDFHQACAQVRISTVAAKLLRQRDPDFAAAWDRALAVAGPTLEQIAYERAVHGWEEPVFAGGKQVGTRRRYSETLLRTLVLRQHKAEAMAAGTGNPKELVARAEEAARAAGGHFGQRAGRDETVAELTRKLERIAKRKRAEAVREAERLMALGLAP